MKKLITISLLLISVLSCSKNADTTTGGGGAPKPPDPKFKSTADTTKIKAVIYHGNGRSNPNTK